MTDVANILAERKTTHGDYNEHATIAQSLKKILRGYPPGKWGALSDSQKETLEMIAHKIGRILAGDPNHKDHWDDIAGYAMLVSRQIEFTAFTPDTTVAQNPQKLPDTGPTVINDATAFTGAIDSAVALRRAAYARS